MLSPFALIYWLMFGSAYSDLLSNSMSLNVLLLAAGVVTGAPIVLYGRGAPYHVFNTGLFSIHRTYAYVCSSGKLV